SCDKDTSFEYDLVPSHKDGIQNLDEEGVDCGGSSGTPCPSCFDGIQNQNEEGVDCGGICGTECPKATPRADALAGSGLPYFHTFETDESFNNLSPIENNTVTVDYAFVDPAGSEDLVTRYNRPEGLVADGFSDFKFEKFNQAIDFSTYNKFTLDVFIPSGTAFEGPFTPTAELIFLDSSNPEFWTTWTVLNFSIEEEDFGTWVTARFDGGDALANANIYDQIAIRIGGSNHQTAATFYMRDFLPTNSLVQDGTPRYDALMVHDFPFFHTFEAATSGHNLAEPDFNSVAMQYGQSDPAGSANGVGRYNRPEGNVSDGFSDFKFAAFESTIDFSTYSKFAYDVYVPSNQEYDSNFKPLAEVIFLDNTNPEFWTTWTVIQEEITEDQYDSWVTVTFDGGDNLANSSIYNQIAIRIGGFGHQTPGTFYIKDFRPVE
ncbi:MAG: hypothetical protein AAF985_27720, partial [Bacteroidota bacterium]